MGESFHGDWFSVYAAAIMCMSFMVSIRVLRNNDQDVKFNASSLVFVGLETVAMFSSVGVLTVNTWVDSVSQPKLERGIRQVLALSLLCSAVAASFLLHH
ncbi:hypothetical protein SUGI_0970140 [Cryptomeria japonica]|nr:hypothetical protein SUGI_0970140 [Cryptomeria japonica]